MAASSAVAWEGLISSEGIFRAFSCLPEMSFGSMSDEMKKTGS